MKRTNNYIDFLKGTLAILVIVGHCMLYGFSNTISSDIIIEKNYLFRIIYSFHMPLFMIISGFYTFKSIEKKSISNVVKSRFNQLILPLLIISIITSLNNLFGNYINLVLYKFINNLWFGWAVFYYTILVYIVDKKFNNKLLYLVAFVILFFMKIPNATVLKFEMIFFLIGYYYSKNNCLLWEKIQKLNKILRILFSIIGLLLMSFIYTSNMPIHVTGVFNEISLSNFGINITRWIIGLLNSIFYMCIVKELYPYVQNSVKSLISRFGQKSYEYYIIHCYIVQWFLTFIGKHFDIHFDYFILVVEVLVVTCVTTIVCLTLEIAISAIKDCLRRLK